METVLQELSGGAGNPVSLAATFVLVSLIPILVLSMTSFVKLSVVFSLLRSALGAQQVPSGAISGMLALVLSCHIMHPVGVAVIENANQHYPADGIQTFSAGLQYADTVTKPLKQFLQQHSYPRERSFFLRHAREHEEQIQLPSACQGEQSEAVTACDIPGESFFSLVPAFVLSQLKDAFAIGFLLYIPFLVIDLVVANILVGLGMMMVSPMVVSLPFKLALFIAADGWFLLTKSLLLSFQ